MSTLKTIIIGNNVAGTTLAKALRDADAEVEIDIFTDERMAYYPRPKLIDYLSGSVREEDLPFYPPDWYDRNRLRLHLGARVERIDPAGRRVFVNGSWSTYDKLVLATGSSSYVPPFEGLPKGNVFTLRTIEDARKIREAAATAKHSVVVGGGLLGLECARAICTGFPHLSVTILEYAEHILMKQLDHEGATILQRWIESTGTKIVTRAETVEVLGGPIAEGVRLKDGTRIQGDIVIISAGTRSDTSLAKDAGLKVNKGVVVDSSLRTSNPDIFAVGDACEYNGQVWAMIPPALEQARIAARRILGQDAPEYRGSIPSNTLKVVGIDLTSVGTVRSQHDPPEPGFEEIRASTPEGSVYRKFVLKDGKMIGAIVLGSKKDVNKIARIIKEGTPVDHMKESLRDPSFSFP